MISKVKRKIKSEIANILRSAVPGQKDEIRVRRQALSKEYTDQ